MIKEEWRKRSSEREVVMEQWLKGLIDTHTLLSMIKNDCKGGEIKKRNNEN